MKKQNFRQNQADTCVFIKEASQASNIKEITIIAVYVDGVIIITSNQNEMDEIKGHMSKAFKMKDMGSLHYCLGVNIEQTEDEIRLSQKQYIMKMIERYELQDVNPVSTPMDLNVKHLADDGCSKTVERNQYQSMIGSLLYTVIATRPDISHAVGALSKFNSAPIEARLTAAKLIITYLKGTINVSIQYRKTGNLKVIGYSDEDWAADMEHRNSTTGNVFIMAGGPISWLSQKQSTVALSTAEAEYIALSSAAREAVWLKQLLKDLQEDGEQAITVMEDNQGAIAMTKNPMAHRRPKHIDIRYHFVREELEKGNLQLQYCNTKETVADIFTKPICKSQFLYLRSKLGMRENTASSTLNIDDEANRNCI